MNYKYDTNGLSRLSDEIEEVAKEIRLLKHSFLSGKLHAYKIRKELRDIYRVPSNLTILIVKSWHIEKEEKW